MEYLRNLQRRYCLNLDQGTYAVLCLLKLRLFTLYIPNASFLQPQNTYLEWIREDFLVNENRMNCSKHPLGDKPRRLNHISQLLGPEGTYKLGVLCIIIIITYSSTTNFYRF